MLGAAAQLDNFVVQVCKFGAGCTPGVIFCDDLVKMAEATKLMSRKACQEPCKRIGKGPAPRFSECFGRLLGVIEKAEQAFCFSELFSQTLGERACLRIPGL